jgi:hypothetical protein
MLAANDPLAHPPVVGLALSRSLGFTVVARLAARHGVQVRLTQTAFGGTTAVVTVPTAVLAQAPEVTQPVVPQLALVTEDHTPAQADIWTPPSTLAEAVPSVDHVEEELEAMAAPTMEVAPEPQVTGAGLVKRVRGANLPKPDDGAGPAVRASTRSPEQIQSMLSRYRSGLQRGRDNNGGDE